MQTVSITYTLYTRCCLLISLSLSLSLFFFFSSMTHPGPPRLLSVSSPLLLRLTDMHQPFAAHYVNSPGPGCQLLMSPLGLFNLGISAGWDEGEPRDLSPQPHEEAHRGRARPGRACKGQGRPGQGGTALLGCVGERSDWVLPAELCAVTRAGRGARPSTRLLTSWENWWCVAAFWERFTPSWTAVQLLVPVTACLWLANTAAIPWALKCSLSAATNFLPFRGDQMFLPENISRSFSPQGFEWEWTSPSM